jgi:hypothetical protein
MEWPGPIALPCPLSAGWKRVEQTVLPRSAGGGLSAGAYSSGNDTLWLLSDGPNGSIGRWQGLRHGGLAGLRPLAPLPLPQPQPMDGEGLVLDGASLWVASEGRLQPPRPAELLRYDLVTGQLQQRVALPADWQLQQGSGLHSNGGPESLTRLPGSGALLMAAERPLQQDPTDRVRLLRWPVQRKPLQPLALPSGWGLTDLLATDRAARPLVPLQQWNLDSLGLPRDNWEVLLAAPPLADGRPTLILASDDNFNPLQASHLVRLSPVRHPDCKP